MLYWLFSQQLPFFSDTNTAVQSAHRIEDIAAAITCAPISYQWGPWKGMSRQGVDFIQSCLVRDEASRIGASEALSHPWLREHVDVELLLRPV